MADWSSRRSTLISRKVQAPHNGIRKSFHGDLDVSHKRDYCVTAFISVFQCLRIRWLGASRKRCRLFSSVSSHDPETIRRADREERDDHCRSPWIHSSRASRCPRRCPRRTRSLKYNQCILYSSAILTTDDSVVIIALQSAKSR